MVELTRYVCQPHHHIKLSAVFFKDLQTWKTFICHWNGAAFFLSTSWVDSHSLELYTDASGTLGVWRDFWPQMVSRLLANPSTARSARHKYCLAKTVCHCGSLSLVGGGDAFANKRIMFFCDNESVVHIVNSIRSRIPRVMDLVRHLNTSHPGKQFLFEDRTHRREKE